MADDAQYEGQKRKYEEETSPPPPPRRKTGFSSGPIATPDPNAPPQTAAFDAAAPLNEFQLAKQKLQELASRAFNAEAKRSKVDNGGGYGASADQKSLGSNIQVGNTMSIPVSQHSYAGSKKIEIPNGRVGVIIGKAGETIKYLQIQSGARIQVTRDADHDPTLPHRIVELMGNQDQIAKAEQLINEVLAEADTGGPGSVSRRLTGSTASEQFAMTVPNNKVGLVIGKGGETIKNIQARSGARVQVIPLHPPPGDMSNERTVQIDGSSEQIEIAKQMVNEVIENRVRNPAMAGGYSQQGYQAQPQNWAAQPPQVQQPGGYGYMQQQQQQPGSYPSQAPYSGYPPQPAPGGYAQTWDQSSAPQSQQAPQAAGYDYYGQQAQTQQQQQPTSAPPADNSGYNYNQPPTSGGYGQQGYAQDGYGGQYQAPPAQSGYGQPPSNPPQSGYDPQTGYDQQHAHPPSYAAQGETGQAPPPQQGYTGQPSPNPNPAYPTHGGYGAPPTSQAGYGTPSPAQGGYGSGYGPPQGQRTPPNPQASYGQPQQSPSQGGGYAQPSPGQQPGYPPSGYGQPDTGAPRAPATTAAATTYGGAAAQSGAYPPYGAPPVTPPSYGQQQAAYYGGAYSQPPAYPSDGNVAGAAPVPAAAPAAAQPSGATKTSSES